MPDRLKNLLSLPSSSFWFYYPFWLSFDVWQTGGLVVVVLIALSWTRQLPVGGLAIYQKESNSQGIMSLIFTLMSWILLPLASCNGSLALLPLCFYQLPDYSVVVHPNAGVVRMWGRRRKSPSSHSHTDGCHMGFWGKAPLDPATQTTVNSLLLWHNHWWVPLILTISFSLWYNWWPVRSADVSRLVGLWLTNQLITEKKGWQVGWFMLQDHFRLTGCKSVAWLCPHYSSICESDKLRLLKMFLTLFNVKNCWWHCSLDWQRQTLLEMMTHTFMLSSWLGLISHNMSFPWLRRIKWHQSICEPWLPVVNFTVCANSFRLLSLEAKILRISLFSLPFLLHSLFCN